MRLLSKILLALFVALMMMVKQSFAYELPTLTGDLTDINKFKSSYLKSKPIPTTKLFNLIIDCYPAKSLFNIDVKLTVGNKQYENINDTTSQQGFYAGIVATMPLYSITENERIRNQEYKRRQEISKLVANLSEHIVKKNLAVRKIALFTSLEKREQLRVKSGFTVVSDQVKYLEKLANEHENKTLAKTEIESTRLQLLAHCEKSKVPNVKKFLGVILQ